MEEISLEEAKIHLKNLLYDTYDFRKYSRETDRQAINKVLKELENRIPRKDIEDKINEFIEKPLLDIEETEKFKFEHTLDGLYAIKYGVIHVLNELLKYKE